MIVVAGLFSSEDSMMHFISVASDSLLCFTGMDSGCGVFSFISIMNICGRWFRFRLEADMLKKISQLLAVVQLLAERILFTVQRIMRAMAQLITTN
jgi:hypothetical protein